MTNSQPFSSLQGTSEWASVDRAVHELAQNRDLVETTPHEYIVGYICKALAGSALSEPSQGTQLVSEKVRLESLASVRAAVRRANTASRDLVEELIAERRLEAQRG